MKYQIQVTGITHSWENDISFNEETKKFEPTTFYSYDRAEKFVNRAIKKGRKNHTIKIVIVKA